MEISEQEYFDNGILMVAMVKAGVELAFETMTAAGIIAESAYYESLHETPLIANTIARKKLYEMNATISDTAEYGCYLYNHACVPLLADFMTGIHRRRHRQVASTVADNGCRQRPPHRGQRGDPQPPGRGHRQRAPRPHGRHEAHRLIRSRLALLP